MGLFGKKKLVLKAEKLLKLQAKLQGALLVAQQKFDSADDLRTVEATSGYRSNISPGVKVSERIATESVRMCKDAMKKLRIDLQKIVIEMSDDW